MSVVVAEPEVVEMPEIVEIPVSPPALKREAPARETIKLSEAIRLGAKLRPQAFCTLFQKNALGEVTGSCALGAAYEGIFGPID